MLAYHMVGGLMTNYVQIASIRSEVKQRLKAGVPAAELTQIYVSTKRSFEITWVKEGKEFIYNGKMYDVVSSTKDPNGYTYQCVTDEQEDVLFAQLDELVSKATHSKKRSDLVQKIVEYLATEENRIGISNPIHLQLKYSSVTAKLSTVAIDVSTPPPDLLRG
jgi:hypothetical protein